MSKKTLTTNKLIHTIKLRASIPESQNSFSEEDFLYFINEEMDLGVTPHVLMYHEDYFLFTEDITLVPGTRRYAIPSRAIGSKLRDVSYYDGANQYEMTRISVEDVSDYFMSFDQSTTRRFYIEGSEIVIPSYLGNQSGSLRVSYYLRPNAIVSEDDTVIVTSVDRTNGLVTVDKYPERFNDETLFDIISAKSPFRLLSKEVTPDGLPTETNLNFTFGTKREVQLTMPTFGTLSNGDYLTITSGGQDYVFYLDLDGSAVAPIVSGTIIEVDCTASVNITNVVNAMVSTINSVFTNQAIITSLNSTNILNIQNGGVGISVGNNFTTSTTGMTVTTTVVSEGTVTIPNNVLKNDIIACVDESSIPQIPLELHSLLAQRCAMRCLESLGDTEGLQSAAIKLSDMEQKTGSLIDNRVESSPLKIVPRHSTLRRRVHNTRR